MKILLLIILYLISGPVDCTDVNGYSGGSVIITSDIQWNPSHTKYICKMEQSVCNDIIRFHSPSIQVQYKRFMLYINTQGNFLVLIRKLKPQDAGTYIFGAEDQKNYIMNLKVRNDSSCGVSKIMTAHLGQNITITCKYPGEYEKNYKYVYTVDDETSVKEIINTSEVLPKTTENSRFSISDDRSAKVFSLNISNVKEADEVFYLLGVWNKVEAVGYYSFFTEIQLHVKGSSVIIIRVCVCVTLLLIGGCTLLIIYTLRHKKTQANMPSFRNKENKKLNPDNNTDSASVNENIGTSSI
ncbi:uncharacterized protein LOC131366079 isoform X2 [Hemibagrus wyckioides]|nr:uncharacterized protein LOC131366079 isoform X2 [Hemibagrus wyckioides]